MEEEVEEDVGNKGNRGIYKRTRDAMAVRSMKKGTSLEARYNSPPELTTLLLDHCGFIPANSHILDPCCGGRGISNVLRDHKFTVQEKDLYSLPMKDDMYSTPIDP